MEEEKTKWTKSELEATLGQTLRVIRPRWEDIAGSVIAVNLDIGYFRARCRLGLEDMGLEHAGRYTEFLKENVSLGQKYLLPRDRIGRLERLEAQARALLQRLSFATPIGYLVPLKSYRTFREGIERLRGEFQSEVATMAADRDRLVETMRPRYAEAARAAYKASKDLPYTAEVDVPDDFIEDFIAQVLSLIPCGEEIRQAASFEYYPSYIETPPEMEQARLEAQRLAQEQRLRALEMQEKELAIQATGAAALEQVRLKTQAEREKLRLEQELHAEIVRKQSEAKKAKIEATIDLLAVTLRQTIVKACRAVLKSIHRNHNRLVAASARRLRNLIDQIRALNFNDDAALDNYLKQIEAKLTYRRTEQGTEDVAVLLQQVGTVVEAELLALGAKTLDDPVCFLEISGDGLNVDKIASLKQQLMQPPEPPAEAFLPLFELVPVQELPMNEDVPDTQSDPPLFEMDAEPFDESDSTSVVA